MTTVASWLAAAIADAEGRGLPELKPMLEALARATEGLRKADAALHTSHTNQTAAENKP
jgi:hypothetical protein